MRAKEAQIKSDRNRRPARDVIDAVLENMRKNLEPLKYSTLVPSRYLIYLHPAEYARLEGIITILKEQTIRALSEEVAALNRPSMLRHYAQRILRDRDARVENPSEEWTVEFLPDPDGDLQEGDILIDSELLLPASPDLGVGERTRLVKTVHSGQRTTGQQTPGQQTTTKTVSPATQSSGPFATIEYDDAAGHHSFDVGNSVTIGRGGAAYPVDIKIATSVDVSREHARIRRDSRTGEFFLIDLSTLGTTLDGRHIPRGYDEIDGTKRLNGSETRLPEQARIGLADIVYLRFCRVHR